MEMKQFTEWLQMLELQKVAITATIDPSGRLGAVGGLWPKLLAAAKDAAYGKLLRVVVVAQEQDGVPSEWLEPDASPPRAIRAATLQEAVKALCEEHAPRFAVCQWEREQCANLDILGKPELFPIEKYYQVLPLLRDVKKEQLPREPGEPKKEEEAERGLRPVDILRWEEELRAEQVTYERITLEQVFEDFRSVVKEAKSAVPRFVVLGPPGSGKTTLEQYLAWQAANRQLSISGRNLIPARVRLREWEAWAVKPLDPESSLPEYLAEHYKDRTPAPTTKQWRGWLQHGDVLLLLDGLDEITGNQSFLTALKTALDTFKDCPTVLTCRTVSFEQHRTLCPDFPVFTLAGLDENQRDAYVHAFPAENPDRYNPDALTEQLNRTPQMHPLAANPLLLSIICFVVDDRHGVTLPARRNELYDKAVDKLLMRPQRVEISYSGIPPDLDDKRCILERIAFNLFTEMGQQRQLTFNRKSLKDELKKAVTQAGYATDFAPTVNALRTDFTQNSGILRGDDWQGYFFLHLTIQEFLVAATLAKLVNEDEQGWEAEVKIGHKTCTVRKLVDKKAWDPRWQEVMTLLAGQLKNPAPLLQMLSQPDPTPTNPHGDDLFRHRLALTALCLPEIPSATRDSQSEIVGHITTDAFSFWWQHNMNKTGDAVPHLTRALPALGQVNGFILSKVKGRMKGMPLLDWICQKLHDADWGVRGCAAAVLEAIGAPLAQQPAVLAALVMALRDPDWAVREHAAAVLRGIGALLAQQPAVLAALVTALRDPVGWVCGRAAEALEAIGALLAQQPAVLAALVTTALHDPDWKVRWRAAAALEAIGAPLAQQPAVLDALVTALRDPGEGVSEGAAAVLGGLMTQGVRIFSGRSRGFTRRGRKVEGRTVAELSQLKIEN